MAQTLTCPFPSDVIGISPSGFKLHITKLPTVVFFAQKVNIPEMSLPAPIQGTPLAMNPLAGETLEFGDLTVEFVIDAGLKNYRELYDWLVGLAYPENNNQYVDFINSQSGDSSELQKHYSDGFIEILNSSNEIAGVIHFKDLVPTSLSGVTFDTTIQDVQYLVGVATFKLTEYWIE